MDNTETYIKMSDCEEIQKERPQALIGLVDHYYEGNYQYTIDSDGNVWCYKNRFIWLPRQCQLQEMVFRISAIITLCDFWGWFRPSTRMGELKTDQAYEDLRNRQEREEYTSRFTSMEQLWLAFVMKECYKKVWSGEDWVND